jgi:adenylate kinase
MQTRADDTPAVVRARLAVYRAECGPVEDFYAADGRLSQFHITGGIPETMPRLLKDVLALVRANAPPAKA